jgi:hypothetical protein
MRKALFCFLLLTSTVACHREEAATGGHAKSKEVAVNQQKLLKDIHNGSLGVRRMGTSDKTDWEVSLVSEDTGHPLSMTWIKQGEKVSLYKKNSESFFDEPGEVIGEKEFVEKYFGAKLSLDTLWQLLVVVAPKIESPGGYDMTAPSVREVHGVRAVYKDWASWYQDDTNVLPGNVTIGEKPLLIFTIDDLIVETDEVASSQESALAKIGDNLRLPGNGLQATQ